jgi:large subunit ribosomal protein L13
LLTKVFSYNSETTLSDTDWQKPCIQPHGAFHSNKSNFTRFFVPPSRRAGAFTMRRAKFRLPSTIFTLQHNQRIGHMALALSHVLQGKHKPFYHPGWDMGDYCVVINAERIRFSTDHKEKYKLYWKDSGYPGGRRATTAKFERQRNPTKLLKKAVWGAFFLLCPLFFILFQGMLPRGDSRVERMRRLLVYPGPFHPHTVETAPPNPQTLETRRKKWEEYLERQKQLREEREKNGPDFTKTVRLHPWAKEPQPEKHWHSKAPRPASTRSRSVEPAAGPARPVNPDPRRYQRPKVKFPASAKASQAFEQDE